MTKLDLNYYLELKKIGKSFMGALHYNLRKMILPDRSRRAEILASNFTNMNIGQIKRETEMVRSLRPNLNRYAYHTSLNFPGEELTGLFRSTGVEFDKWLLAAAERIEETNSQLMDSEQDLENPRDYSEEYIRDFNSNSVNIQIADDVDDEAIKN